jgi:hypothetical protein
MSALSTASTLGHIYMDKYSKGVRGESLHHDDVICYETSFILFVENFSERFPSSFSLMMIRHVMVVRSSDKENTSSLLPTPPSAETD